MKTVNKLFPGTKACQICSYRSHCSGNAIKDVLRCDDFIQDKTREAMKIFDAIGVSLRNEDGTYRSLKEIFEESPFGLRKELGGKYECNN